MRRLWVRWIARDLRQRWLLIVAIALVLALGTGTYAALTGTSEWRTRSNDASFSLLKIHDLQVALTPGTSVPEGTLTSLVSGTVADVSQGDSDSAALTAVRERLVLPVQVIVTPPPQPDGTVPDADASGKVLVPGRIIAAGPNGPTVAPDGQAVDLVHIDEGRAPDAGDPVPTAVIESKFAHSRNLPGSGRVQISGGVEIPYVGHGMGPEEFVVEAGATSVFLANAGFAVIYTSLAGGQQALGAAGQVNEAVLTLSDVTDRAAVAQALTDALAVADPPISATVSTRDDVVGYRALYEDIEGDEQFWTMISVLMLAGATFAAVNLTARVVEGQRREIGIGMALGSGTAALAVRPMLFGVAIAVVGVVLGLAVGLLLIIPLRGIYTTLLPLPVWETPLVLQPFIVAALFGVLLPILATGWPVWRAVRVEPVAAIRVGHLAGKGGGWTSALRWMRLPGRSYWHVPVRNVLRTPRRTILTALGIATAITVMVTLGGLIDSFRATVGGAESEITTTAEDRLTVTLDTYRRLDDPTFATVASAPGVAVASPGLVLPATARPLDGQAADKGSSDGSIDLLLEVVDLDTAPWKPTITAGDERGGLLLTEVAAEDLGVGPGDTVLLSHPQAGPGGLRFVDSEVPVAGTHPYPLRPVTYLDEGSAQFLGLSGVANTVQVLPAEGTAAGDADSLRRELFDVPGVTSVTSQRDALDQFSSALDQILGILAVVAAVALVLALLIAFNSASIAAEERRREHATMQAYGLGVRTILGLNTLESVLVGLIGTMIGLVLGWLVLSYMVGVQIPQTMPDIGIIASIAPVTVLVAVGLGVLAVAAAPLLTGRKLRRMDIPATLRVME